MQLVEKSTQTSEFTNLIESAESVNETKDKQEIVEFLNFQTQAIISMHEEIQTFIEDDVSQTLGTFLKLKIILKILRRDIQWAVWFWINL